MAAADYETTLDVGGDALFDTIIKYEAYPDFVSDVKRVSVERKGPSAARVVFTLSVMKEFTYTLDLKEDREKGEVSWELVESDLFSKNSGGWELTKISDEKTAIRYHLDVEFKVKVPGFILKRLVKGNLPSMVKSFADQAASQ